jgi:hypothetical protein
MKKIFIVGIILIILLIIGAIGGYFYYDKYIRHGAPNSRNVPKSEGFHFDNSLSEKSIGFWNFNGNFQISADEFASEQIASNSFKTKSDTYISLITSNGGTVIKNESNNGNGFFSVKLADNSNLVIMQKKNKVIEVTNSDKSAQETEKFVRWFIRYWL